MNTDDLSFWLLVILRKESYDCGDYEVSDTPATLGQVEAMFEGLNIVAQVLCYENISEQTFDAQGQKEVSRTNVEDPHGEIEIVRGDGSVIRARAMVSRSYSWVPPQQTEEYKEWVKDAAEIFEEPCRGQPWLYGEMRKHLSVEFAPPSVKVFKTLRHEGVFVSVGDVPTLLQILRRMNGEIDPEYWEYYHAGHGKRSENPIPVSALIIKGK